MSKYAIVVVGYKRTESITRLLKSLGNADYNNDNVDLIISIDYSGTNNVETVANDFKWDFGNKRVVAHSKQLGLRNHILKCGDYLEEYDAIAVLEDDIFVSPNFYNYMVQAVDFYKDDDNIAGISLYSHLWSEYINRPFIPEKNKYDVFFMQYAQSWGQIWMKRQWFAFKEWYKKNNNHLKEQVNIPSNVTNWPESSWLKYHIKYCIENNKYFVYPYVSLSTNFTEIGQHNMFKSTAYQVPLMNDISNDYKFISFKDVNNTIIYDAFFERMFLGKIVEVDDNELCVDLYGGKSEKLYKKYLLSSERKNFKIIKSYALELRPHEMNVILDIPGDDIFLYDTSISDNNEGIKDTDIKKWFYDEKNNNYRLMAKVLLRRIASRFKKV
jgi:hypothetical protein